MTTSPVLEGFRISPQQRRLWSLNPMPAATAEVRVDGPLDLDALERAARRITARQEILRTALRRDGGLALPVQVVLPELAPQVSLDDLSPLAEDERRVALAELADARRAPYENRDDLARGARLSLTAVRLEATEHRLLYRLPAVVADAAAMERLVREIAWAYAAETGGATPEPLLDEPLQYADLAEVLNELVEGDDAADGRHHWASRDLAGVASPALPPAGATQGASTAFRLLLDAGTAKAVDRLADELGVGAEAICLAAWLALVHRLTGTDRLLTGVVAAGRNFEGLDEALGPFARLLPLVSEARRGQSFRDLVKRTAARVVAGEEWQEAYDPDDLAARGGGAPEPATAFEHRALVGPVAGGPTVFTPLRTAAPLDHADARLTVIRRPADGADVLEVEVRCRPEHAAAGSAHLHARRYARLLAAGVASPDRPLGRLEILADEERARLLNAFNDTAADRDATPFACRFETHAESRPDSPALRWAGGELTYVELERHSAALAARLVGLGCGPEAVVGVSMETSPEAVVALVAVLRAGAAFLPMDPTHPAEHLAFLAADAGVGVVLVRAGEGASSHLPAGVETVAVDLAAPPPEDAAAPPVAACPHRLAYVLYTSGSTGRPKGVTVSEANLLHYLDWVEERLLAGAVDTVAATGRLSFDAFLKQLLAPLAAGRQVWLPAAGGVDAPSELLAELAGRPGASLNTVPSVWDALLRHLEEAGSEDGGPAALLLGGEATPPELLERTFHRLPGIEVWNLYGPTEVTANATAGRLLPGAGVHLGRPLDNARVYLLDAALEPVPAGVTGEIHVAGDGVARGYLGRPRLTAEAFVPDPFASTPGGRLYRTGDLGRFDAAGTLYFAGRADHQVKVRGIRVELGEVEALVASHPAVGRCAAALVGEGAGARLAAVLTPAGGAGAQVSADIVARDLAGRVPDHLVPALWAVVDELPTLATGKLDRSAVADLAAPTGSGAVHRPPETATERALAAIWQDLLDVPEVGAGDDFFALGGHSLLAIQLLSRIRSELGAGLPMARVLEAGDLASLAAAVDEHGCASAGGDVPTAITRRPDDAGSPLSLAEEKLWFLAQVDPASPAYNVPAALRLEGTLEPAVLGRAFAELERHHEVLRSAYPARRGHPLRELRPAGDPALPVADLTTLAPAAAEAEVGRLARLEARRPFDLAKGGLLRRAYVATPGGTSTLLMTAHHIVTDGWSTKLLVDDLARVYDAFAAGRSSPLGDPGLGYADYAYWQRRVWQGEALEEQVAYWRKRLEGLDEEPLATDRRRGEAPSSRGATLYGAISGEVADALEELAAERGATLFMSLLAAFKVVLARETGSRDVAVGTDVMNRDRTETHGMVGFFVNQVVLRTDLAGDPGFGELVDRVRETALGAYSHQELPFHQLVSRLGGRRDLARNPLFQVMFSVQNTPRPERRLGGVEFEPLRAETASSVFDLSLYVLTEREAGGLPLALRYNTDLFRRETMRRLLQSFLTVADAAARRPGASLSRLLADLDEAEARRAEAAASRARAASPRGRRRRVPAASQEPRRSS